MSDLPDGWAEALLGELTTQIRGVTYRKAEARATGGTGLVPILRATNFGDGGLVLSADLVYVPTARVRPEQMLLRGDILIASSSGSSAVVGKSALIRERWRGAFGAFCAVLRVRPELDARYVALLVSSEPTRRRWSLLAAGTNINNLKRDHIAQTHIRVPPLAEQRRIVAAIEEQFSRLDAADTILRDVVLRIEALRRAALNAPLSEISRTRPLAELASTQLGKMLSSKAKAGVNPRPYLRNKNVRWYGFELGDLLEMDFNEAERAKFALQPGDVVVCEGGEVGRSAVWRGEVDDCYFQKAVHRVRTTGALKPEFLVHVLRWFADMNAFERYITGSTISHLPQEDLRTLPIPAPSTEEQERIVASIEQALSLIASLREAVEPAKKRSAALRHAILERAFRGELVPQDPDDEPASVLLERIRADRQIAPKPKGRRQVTA